MRHVAGVACITVAPMRSSSARERVAVDGVVATGDARRAAPTTSGRQQLEHRRCRTTASSPPASASSSSRPGSRAIASRKFTTRAMRDHHALRPAGRARRVDDVRGIVGARTCRLERRQRRRVRGDDRCVGVEQQLALAWQRERFGERARRHEQASCAVLGHEPQAFAREGRIERHVGGAGLEHAEHRATMSTARSTQRPTRRPRPTPTRAARCAMRFARASSSRRSTPLHRPRRNALRRLIDLRLEQPVHVRSCGYSAVVSFHSTSSRRRSASDNSGSSDRRASGDRPRPRAVRRGATPSGRSSPARRDPSRTRRSRSSRPSTRSSISSVRSNFRGPCSDVHLLHPQVAQLAPVARAVQHEQNVEEWRATRITLRSQHIDDTLERRVLFA